MTWNIMHSQLITEFIFHYEGRFANMLLNRVFLDKFNNYCNTSNEKGVFTFIHVTEVHHKICTSYYYNIVLLGFRFN